MFVNLVVDCNTKFGLRTIAQKTITRQDGFFAFPGMLWHFS